MEHLYTQCITIFLGFFAIMNPIANAAVFASLVGHLEKTEQIRVAIKAIVITYLIIALFAILGKTIFYLFGITLPALRIAGGILVFVIGYHMLNGIGSKLHFSESDEGADISVSPLAVPLLAGPGTIATTMNYSASGGVSGILITLIVFALLCVLTLFCFISSSRIVALIGSNGMSIITRLMGLILAVIGTQMVIAGFEKLVKMWL